MNLIKNSLKLMIFISIVVDSSYEYLLRMAYLPESCQSLGFIISLICWFLYGTFSFIGLTFASKSCCSDRSRYFRFT